MTRDKVRNMKVLDAEEVTPKPKNPDA
jgi:hypothetical protein